MNNSKLQEWALVAEIVSAIVVVASVMFLVFEIRANTEAMQSAGLESISERTQNFALNVATDPDLAEISALFFGGTGEQNRVVSYLVSVMKIGEESFLQHRDGFLSEEVWNTRASYVLMHMQNEIGRNLFEQFSNGGNFVPSYISWLDQAIVERYGQR